MRTNFSWLLIFSVRFFSGVMSNTSLEINVTFDGYCAFLNKYQPTSLSEYQQDRPLYLSDYKHCGTLDSLGLLGPNNKVIVISTHTPLKPYLIRLQKKSLDSFLSGPFEYIVYGANILDDKSSNEIRRVAEDVGGKYRRIPMEVHYERRCLFPHTTDLGNGFSTRSTDSLQYMLRDAKIYCSKSHVLQLDADVMLIRPVNTTDDLASSNLMGLVDNERLFRSEGLDVQVKYLWSPVILFDMNTLPGRSDFNFDVGRVELAGLTLPHTRLYLDAGGMTYLWLAKHNPNITWMDNRLLTDDLFSKEKDIRKLVVVLKRKSMLEDFSRAQILGGKYIHLRNAGGWMGEEETNSQSEIIYKIFKDFLLISSQYYRSRNNTTQSKLIIRSAVNNTDSW